jgi:hypothetical protein
MLVGYVTYVPQNARSFPMSPHRPPSVARSRSATSFETVTTGESVGSVGSTAVGMADATSLHAVSG